MTRELLGLALLTALGSACATEGAPERACTLIGCGYLASFSVTSTDDAASLVGARVEVCIGSRCVTVPVPMVIPNTGNSAVAQGDFTLQCGASQLEGMPIEVAVTIDQDEEITGLMPGDTYTLTLTAADGTLLLGKTWIATSYMESDPNGPGCAPHCSYPQLTAAM